MIGTIDVENQTVKVGPNTPVGTILRASMEVGLMPRVRPGFPALTPQADTVDHTTFAEGVMGDSFVSKTLLLPDGSLLRVDEQNYPDLFFGTNGDYRTLATIVEIELQLKKLAEHINFEFIPARCGEHAIEMMMALAETGNVDTLEAIAFSPSEAVVIVGVESESPTYSNLVTFKNPGDPWFHRLAMDMMLSGGGGISSDIVSASERFRYGAYWMGEYLAKWFGSQDEAWIRRFHDNLSAEELYALMAKIGNGWQFFIQDYIGPVSESGQLLQYFEELGIYPVWLNLVKPTMEKRNILQPNLHLDPDGNPSNEWLVEIGPYGRPGEGPYPSYPSFKKKSV